MAEKSRSSTRTPIREQRARYIKQKIYKISMGLFNKHGFDKVKISDICNEANISTGTFYYYFASKEHIMMEYSDVSDTFFEKNAVNIKYQTASEFLLKLVEKKIEVVAGDGDSTEYLNRGFIAALKHHSSGSFDINRKAYGFYKKALDEGVASGEFRSNIDTAKATSQLRYIIGGVMMHWCMSNGEFDIYKRAKEETETFIAFISA